MVSMRVSATYLSLRKNGALLEVRTPRRMLTAGPEVDGCVVVASLIVSQGSTRHFSHSWILSTLESSDMGLTT